MQAARIIQKKSRFATAHDLQKVEFATCQLAGTGDLSPLGRSWLFFLVALVRMGYEGIRAPVAAVAAAQYRALGMTRSERSAHRGLAELELAGYIRRQKFRVKADRFASIVHFDMKRFAYWTRQKPHLIPVTVDYMHLHTPDWRKDEVTSESLLVNSRNSLGLEVKQHPRATIFKERFKKAPGENGEGERREHPILYTLRVITQGMGPKKRKPILELARYELANPKERGSGAAWSKWLRKDPSGNGRIAFEDLAIPHEREMVAREQFLPYLQEAMGLGTIIKPVETTLHELSGPPKEEEEPITNPQTPVATPDEIRNLLSAAGLGSVLEAPPDEECQPDTAAEFKRRVEDRAQNSGDQTGAQGLTADEIRVLEGARLRAIGVRGNR